MPPDSPNTEENVASLRERVGIPADGLFPDNSPTVRLSHFEGPLDLLLFLIKKNELDIYDIPIAEITRQYTEILRENEKANIEIAGDFFVMAATLMYIKSRALLPTSEAASTPALDDTNEDLDPRWQLVQQLIQYKRLKESAQCIENLITEQQDYLPRQIAKEDEPTERPLSPVGKMDIWNTFNLILKRLSERILPGEIHDDTVTVSARMEDILELLKSKKSFTFSSLMHEKISISFLAATLLACLELVRLGELRVKQDEIFGEIYCEAPEGV